MRWHWRRIETPDPGRLLRRTISILFGRRNNQDREQAAVEVEDEGLAHRRGAHRGHAVSCAPREGSTADGQLRHAAANPKSGNPIASAPYPAVAKRTPPMAPPPAAPKLNSAVLRVRVVPARLGVSAVSRAIMLT